MLEYEEDRMEAYPASGVGPGSVALVARDRITFRGELGPDLVLAPGLEPELEAAVAMPPGKNPVIRDGLERAPLAGPRHPHPRGP